MTIEFTIPGVPQGKERPRFTQNGATYTPKKTKDYEKLVAWAYQCEAHGAKFTGTIRVDIAAIYPVPHSWSKRKQAEAIDNQILPMVKPDWDNICRRLCGKHWKLSLLPARKRNRPRGHSQMQRQGLERKCELYAQHHRPTSGLRRV